MRNRNIHCGKRRRGKLFSHPLGSFVFPCNIITEIMIKNLIQLSDKVEIFFLSSSWIPSHTHSHIDVSSKAKISSAVVEYIKYIFSNDQLPSNKKIWNEHIYQLFLIEVHDGRKYKNSFSNFQINFLLKHFFLFLPLVNQQLEFSFHFFSSLTTIIMKRKYNVENLGSNDE